MDRPVSSGSADLAELLGITLTDRNPRGGYADEPALPPSFRRHDAGGAHALFPGGGGPAAVGAGAALFLPPVVHGGIPVPSHMQAFVERQEEEIQVLRAKVASLLDEAKAAGLAERQFVQHRQRAELRQHALEGQVAGLQGQVAGLQRHAAALKARSDARCDAELRVRSLVDEPVAVPRNT